MSAVWASALTEYYSSASDSQPTSIIDDETADGNESLSKQGSFWNDEEDE